MAARARGDARWAEADDASGVDKLRDAAEPNPRVVHLTDQELRWLIAAMYVCRLLFIVGHDFGSPPLECTPVVAGMEGSCDDGQWNYSTFEFPELSQRMGAVFVTAGEDWKWLADDCSLRWSASCVPGANGGATGWRLHDWSDDACGGGSLTAGGVTQPWSPRIMYAVDPPCPKPRLHLGGVSSQGPGACRRVPKDFEIFVCGQDRGSLLLRAVGGIGCLFSLLLAGMWSCWNAMGLCRAMGAFGFRAVSALLLAVVCMCNPFWAVRIVLGWRMPLFLELASTRMAPVLASAGIVDILQELRRQLKTSFPKLRIARGRYSDLLVPLAAVCVIGTTTFELVIAARVAAVEALGPSLFDDQKLAQVWAMRSFARLRTAMPGELWDHLYYELDFVQVMPLLAIVGSFWQVSQEMTVVPGSLSRVHGILYGFLRLQLFAVVTTYALWCFVDVWFRLWRGPTVQDRAWAAFAAVWEPFVGCPLCQLCASAIVVGLNIFLLAPHWEQRPLIGGMLPTDKCPVPFETLQVLLHCCYVVSKVSSGKPIDEALHTRHYNRQPHEAWNGLSFLQQISCTPAMDLHCTLLQLTRPGRRPELVVAHRGTKSLESLRVDLRSSRVAHRGLAALAAAFQVNAVEVHRGFRLALKALEEKGLGESLRRFAKETGATRLWFTGHSLGGALATLHALEFSMTAVSDAFDVAVVSFGAPHVGNSNFADLFDKVIPTKVRVVFARDPIPSSGKYGGLVHWRQPYRHTAGLVQINRTGQMVVEPTHLEKTLVFRSTLLAMNVTFACFFLGVRLTHYHQLGSYGSAISRARHLEEAADVWKAPPLSRTPATGLPLLAARCSEAVAGRRAAGSQAAAGVTYDQVQRHSVAVQSCCQELQAFQAWQTDSKLHRLPQPDRRM